MFRVRRSRQMKGTYTITVRVDSDHCYLGFEIPVDGVQFIITSRFWKP